MLFGLDFMLGSKITMPAMSATQVRSYSSVTIVTDLIQGFKLLFGSLYVYIWFMTIVNNERE